MPCCGAAVSLRTADDLRGQRGRIQRAILDACSSARRRWRRTRAGIGGCWPPDDPQIIPVLHSPALRRWPCFVDSGQFSGRGLWRARWRGNRLDDRVVAESARDGVVDSRAAPVDCGSTACRADRAVRQRGIADAADRRPSGFGAGQRCPRARGMARTIGRDVRPVAHEERDSHRARRFSIGRVRRHSSGRSRATRQKLQRRGLFRRSCRRVSDDDCQHSGNAHWGHLL